MEIDRTERKDGVGIKESMKENTKDGQMGSGRKREEEELCR